MVSLNISLNQLLEVIKSLNELEKIQVRSALENEVDVSDQTNEELLRRKKAYEDGKITSRSWNDIKGKYGSL
ncbi:hypothetical protein DYBT9623_02574 [Dyadobacter sp. CECT 9623]|uniref:Addiction module protein n=1 Tax=Dyadobacter linearis TaxID=2823330 RepID=A0ABN7RD67_9BACT|nr:addiction module protein [Dyadobacter sp. CECT 9623]CAG5069837.1 hypothetical protein DYBT9623_02574 [Dyadobacter sp. CECT 9623]